MRLNKKFLFVFSLLLYLFSLPLEAASYTALADIHHLRDGERFSIVDWVVEGIKELHRSCKEERAKERERAERRKALRQGRVASSLSAVTEGAITPQAPPQVSVLQKSAAPLDGSGILKSRSLSKLTPGERTKILERIFRDKEEVLDREGLSHFFIPLRKDVTDFKEGKKKRFSPEEIFKTRSAAWRDSQIIRVYYFDLSAPIGIAFFRPSGDFFGDEGAVSLYITKKFRRMGLGTKVLTSFFKRLSQKEDIEEVEYGFFGDNKASRALLSNFLMGVESLKPVSSISRFFLTKEGDYTLGTTSLFGVSIAIEED